MELFGSGRDTLIHNLFPVLAKPGSPHARPESNSLCSLHVAPLTHAPPSPLVPHYPAHTNNIPFCHHYLHHSSKPLPPPPSPYHRANPNPYKAPKKIQTPYREIQPRQQLIIKKLYKHNIGKRERNDGIPTMEI